VFLGNAASGLERLGGVLKPDFGRGPLYSRAGRGLEPQELLEESSEGRLRRERSDRTISKAYCQAGAGLASAGMMISQNGGCRCAKTALGPIPGDGTSTN